jgi:hypothetical protein
MMNALNSKEFEQMLGDSREIIIDLIEMSELAPNQYILHHIQCQIYFYQMVEEALKAKIADFTWTDKTAFLLKEVAMLGIDFHHDIVTAYIEGRQ